ncbi:MAG: hypothetical protein HY553_03660 [Elusimicrobia bacterium]|nr:hypothetical protein [Elusimicrobiota bacterium]
MIDEKNPETDEQAAADARKIAELSARSPKMLAFARWSMSDPQTREHRDQKDWAKAHGVAQSTLSRWKRDPLFLSILKGWRAEMAPLTANVAAALYKTAVNGDVKAMRAWFELMGEFPKQQIEVSTPLVGLGDFLSTDDPKIRAAGAAQFAAIWERSERRAAAAQEAELSRKSAASAAALAKLPKRKDPEAPLN